MAGWLPVPGGATLTRIAVIGGGIGGLAAAAFLRRAGLAATVYEQAPALGGMGAGLVVAPNAARLLRRLPSEFGLERPGRGGVLVGGGRGGRPGCRVRWLGSAGG